MIQVSNVLREGLKAYDAGLSGDAVAAGAVNGATIDTHAAAHGLHGAQMFGEGVVLVNLRTITLDGGSAPILTVHLEHSDNGSSWADVTDESIVEKPDDTAGEVELTAVGVGLLAFNPAGLKRYVRVVGTVAFTGGSSPSMDYDCMVLFNGPARV